MAPARLGRTCQCVRPASPRHTEKVVNKMLLPPPKHVVYLPGTLIVRDPLVIRSEGATRTADLSSVERIADQVAGVVQAARTTRSAGDADIELRTRDLESRSEAYTLRIDTRGVTLDGDGPRGLFYALQTFRQIIMTEGRQWRCRTIRDAPDTSLRGLSLDVSRGRCPTRETLFNLVNRLAAWKMNHLQLYVEHTFDFEFDPDIGAGSSPLTADDMRALDAYCRERFVELVPSLATFGHMGKVLSLPQYRDLAEIPADGPWESQSWPQRLRGLTIDARSPAARRLLTTMLDEYLPLFSSGLANINADETHDLGRGRNRTYAEHVGKGSLYVEHLRFLHEQCRRHGKRMMFWGDVIRNHPDRLHELPEDAVLLDWGYEADADFPAARSLNASNRHVCVCPGTSGWNRVVNAYEVAEANIANAAATACRNDAAGMLVTDWGDHGHFNMLVCSLPAVAYAAAHAWNAGAAGHAGLDRSIETDLFGGTGYGVLSTLRDISKPGNVCPTWCALYRPWQAFNPSEVMPVAAAHDLRDAAGAAAEVLGSTDAPDVEIAEWRLACEATRLLSEKITLAHALKTGGQGVHSRLQQFSEEIEAFVRRYEATWYRRDRPERLRDIIAVLNKLARETRSLM